MCGRFALSYPRSGLIGWYNAASMPETKPRYNIAPMTDILVIRDSDKGREGSMMRWGFIPHWAKNIKKLPHLINARAETVAEKPIFKHAFHRQRCIIPTSAFYEWQLLADGKHKQPYYMSAKDGCPISFAGLWDTATLNDEIIESCIIITTECNELMRPIHDRMPVMLLPESFDTWLATTESSYKVLKLFLKPFDSKKLQLWPVSTAVNKASNRVNN